jgi:hypothetical protein
MNALLRQATARQTGRGSLDRGRSFTASPIFLLHKTEIATKIYTFF